MFQGPSWLPCDWGWTPRGAPTFLYKSGSVSLPRFLCLLVWFTPLEGVLGSLSTLIIKDHV